MEKKELSIAYTHVTSMSDWTDGQNAIIDRAIVASEKAHADYSNFLVGAAAMLDDGTIYVANNQENAAYPSGLCAERVLIFYLQANFPEKKIKRFAVVAAPKGVKNFKVVSPCGACRQVLIEYKNQFTPDAEFILSSIDKAEGYVFDCVEDLLPFTFDGDFLK